MSTGQQEMAENKSREFNYLIDFHFSCVCAMTMSQAQPFPVTASLYTYPFRVIV